MKKNNYNYNNQTGMYRHKILLRQRTITTDELLQEIETYEDYDHFWAMVKTSKNGESITAGQESTKVQKRYVVKYSSKLDEFINAEKTSFEVVHKGVVFDVKEAINDNDTNETVTIFVEGRV
ncbi:phage head closure protein [Lysinibacillus sp. NPDC096418]|uniref:phage head closure protein n=1 Tax=Lysinibacillus sp. NPDC096418 TaxID=3364138 RepID=UPI00381DBA3A